MDRRARVVKAADDMLGQIDKSVGDKRVFSYQIPHMDDAHKYFGYFATVFLFILFSNLIGLMPFALFGAQPFTVTVDKGD